jgi:hypothetical protein
MRRVDVTGLRVCVDRRRRRKSVTRRSETVNNPSSHLFRGLRRTDSGKQLHLPSSKHIPTARRMLCGVYSVLSIHQTELAYKQRQSLSRKITSAY